MTKLRTLKLLLGLAALLLVLPAYPVPAQQADSKPIPRVHKKAQPASSDNSLFKARPHELTRQLIFQTSGSVSEGQLKELLYRTPSYYPCGYTYTAELRPTSGDPDLYLHEKVSGSWQQLRKSINGGSQLDSFTFRCSDITSTATNVDVDVKGWTDASYNFYLYKETVSTSFTLTFPLSGYSPTSARVTAIVDHDREWNYILTHTGERGSYGSGCRAYLNGTHVPCDPSNAANVAAPWGYERVGGGQYDTGVLNYDDDADGIDIMWYDNHRGYDFAVPRGTWVLAAQSGTVTDILPSLGQVEITHENGFKTYYLHMRSISVAENSPVAQGQKIGEVSDVGATGAVHLHFGVYDASGTLFDPYGRSGLYGSTWE